MKKCDIDKNEIAEHCWNNDHQFDWDNKSILDREKFTTAKKIKETIYSKKEKSINRISYGLPDIWIPALQKTKVI